MLFNWERHLQQGPEMPGKSFTNFKEIQALAQRLGERKIPCLHFPVFAEDTKNSYPGLMISQCIYATFAPRKEGKAAAYTLWLNDLPCRVYKDVKSIVDAIAVARSPSLAQKSKPAPSL